MAGLAVYDMAGPEDRAEELVQLCAAATNSSSADLLNSLRPRIANGDFAGVVRELLENQQAAFTSGTDDEVEGLFILLSSLLKDVDSDQIGIIERLATIITGVTDSKGATARLRVLANLYNTLSDSTNKTEKLAILRSIIRFASDTRQLEALGPLLAGAGSWRARWGISDSEARSLYLLVSSVLSKAGDAEQAQVFLIRYLSTFENDPAAINEEALARAKDAAIGYVKAPAISQRSALPQLAAVKALSRDQRYSSLYDLLVIFSSGTLEEYHAFTGAHGALIAQLGLDADVSAETMRLATLVSLASAKQVLELAAVAQALQIPASEVEGWVVRAVTRGLLDARVDQAAGTLTVSRAVNREFGSAQWVALQAKLRAWRDNIGTLMATVEGGGARPTA